MRTKPVPLDAPSRHTSQLIASRAAGPAKGLLATSPTGKEWLACLGLAALLPLVAEIGKWIRRRRVAAPAVLDAQRALSPERALGTMQNASAPR
jgi:hypothetical protein